MTDLPSRYLQKAPAPKISEALKCGSYKDCFNCSFESKQTCKWASDIKGGTCVLNTRQKDQATTSIETWPQYVDKCPDDLNICEKTVLEQGADDKSKVIKLKMVLPRWESAIPKNYYCNFNLGLNRDYLYTVQVDRFLSHSLSVNLYENIEFQVIGGPKNNEDKILVSNQDLRRTLHHEKSACVPTKSIST